MPERPLIIMPEPLPGPRESRLGFGTSPPAPLMNDARKKTFDEKFDAVHKHIHSATVESINNDDRKPEHDDIQVTSRYNNLDEAFRCLCEDYNVYMSEKISMSKQNLFGWSLQ